MKLIVVTLLLTLSTISCTKPVSIPTPTPGTDTNTVSAAPVAPTEKSDTMPTLSINDTDRACIQDSDCEAVATACSCSCGGAVNIISAPNYAKKWEELCKNYQSKACKIQCNGTISCKNKLCTYGS